MSKAFASNESDDDEPNPVKPSVLPPGTPNYITPAGAQKLEAERERLIAEKTALTDSVENQQRGKAIERDLKSLTDRLNAVHVINPATQPKDRVLFGASVTVRNSSGNTRTWRIVGVDETDLEKGWISWISPLARALARAQEGDVVEIRTPAGIETAEVIEIRYDKG